MKKLGYVLRLSARSRLRRAVDCKRRDGGDPNAVIMTATARVPNTASIIAVWHDGWRHRHADKVVIIKHRHHRY